MGGQPPETLQGLATKLDSLLDLFRRRLLDDREKAKAFDALYEQLAATRAVADGELALPLIRRLIAVIDRLEKSDSELAQSVSAELAEAIFAQGVIEVSTSSTTFDPATQEAIAVVAPGVPAGEVLSVRRRGWSYNGRVIRSAVVEVAVVASETQQGRSVDQEFERRG